MEKKPTPDIREFLTKRDITAGDMKSYYVWQQVIETMQEYAELFHKEKLRGDLKAFNNIVLKLEAEGKIPLIDYCIEDFIKTIE